MGGRGWWHLKIKPEGFILNKYYERRKLQDESTGRHLKDAVDMYRWLAGNLRLWSVKETSVATAKANTQKQ